VIQPNIIAAVDRALRQVEAPYTIGVAQLMPFDQNVLPECRELDGATKAAENARRRAEAEVQVDVAR
ncbi:hypothetical protein Tco_1497109, partial [Tanacetum coccineum]